MRALIASTMIALASLTSAKADDPTGDKSKNIDNCSYLLGDGTSGNLAVGANVCVRSPAPYSDSYALLRCYPPIQEIDLVKRGDPRCGEKYDERERK